MDKVHTKVLSGAATNKPNTRGNSGGGGGGGGARGKGGKAKYGVRDGAERDGKAFTDDFRPNLQEKGDRKYGVRPPAGRGRGRGKGGRGAHQ